MTIPPHIHPTLSSTIMLPDHSSDMNSGELIFDFIKKLHNMLQKETFSSSNKPKLISWNLNGMSFFILNPILFGKELLPVYYSLSMTLSSFLRHLDAFGFKKLKISEEDKFIYGKQAWQYYHLSFCATDATSLPNIKLISSLSSSSPYKDINLHNTPSCPLFHSKAPSTKRKSELVEPEEPIIQKAFTTKGMASLVHYLKNLETPKQEALVPLNSIPDTTKPLSSCSGKIIQLSEEIDAIADVQNQITVIVRDLVDKTNLLDNNYTQLKKIAYEHEYLLEQSETSSNPNKRFKMNPNINQKSEDVSNKTSVIPLATQNSPVKLEAAASIEINTNSYDECVPEYSGFLCIKFGSCPLPCTEVCFSGTTQNAAIGDMEDITHDPGYWMMSI